MATCPECHKQFSDEVETCPEHEIPLVPESVFQNVDRDLEPGTRVGDYEVESKLGEGSFGRVYRAVHPVIGRRVAVKVLNRAMSSDPHAVSRFIAEARAIVEIQSPHIVDIYSFGALQDGRQYHVMELLDGGSLENLLIERGALAPAEAVRILAGMADALAAAHDGGIVHRDLKPENVLIALDKTGQPVPKLLDFGVAKLLGKREMGHRTSTGALIGTPAYMAPEQALGLDIDHRADIYAFGIVAFEMLTGEPPFEAGSLVELVRKHANDPPPALSTLRPELGDAFDAPIAHMLAKDPEDRPATIAACLEAIQAAARRTGIDVSVPVLVSLRPPSAEPSRPGSTNPSWDAETVPVDEAEPPRPRAKAAAAADTVGGTAGTASLSLDPTPRRSRAAGAAAVVGAAVLLAGGLFALTRSDPTDESAGLPALATTMETHGGPTASTAAKPSVPSPPAAVELRVATTVDGAKIYIDGTERGAPPGPFPLRRGDQPVRVEVRAPGYEPAVSEVTPDEDREWTPSLARKASPRPRPATPKPATTRKRDDEYSSEIDIPKFAK